jgi:hypothetical protein
MDTNISYRLYQNLQSIISPEVNDGVILIDKSKVLRSSHGLLAGSVRDSRKPIASPLLRLVKDALLLDTRGQAEVADTLDFTARVDGDKPRVDREPRFVHTGWGLESEEDLAGLAREDG